MEQLCNVCQITVTSDPSGLCDACHLDKAEAVRDDLLAALKLVLEVALLEIPNYEQAESCRIAEAAIAKAEKQA